MLDCVVDSSVAVKWVLDEPDSSDAHRVLVDVPRRGGNLLLIDVAELETANAIWLRQRRGLITYREATDSLSIFQQFPLSFMAAKPLTRHALELAIKYRVAV